MIPAIYVASKVKHANMWRALRQAGYPIISSWIYEAGVDTTSDWPGLWVRCVHEVQAATCLILYLEEGEMLKGALVELGVAFATDIPVYLVTEDSSHSYSACLHPLVIWCPDLGRAFALALAQATKELPLKLE